MLCCVSAAAHNVTHLLFVQAMNMVDGGVVERFNHIALLTGNKGVV
jgi:hypothetical protein